MKINLLFVNKKYRNNIIEAVNEMLTDFPILNNLNIIIHMRKLDRRLGNSFASHRKKQEQSDGCSFLVQNNCIPEVKHVK